MPIESIKKLLREEPKINGISVPDILPGFYSLAMHYHVWHSCDYKKFKVVSFSKKGNTKIFDKFSINANTKSEIMIIFLRNSHFLFFRFLLSLNFNCYSHTHRRGKNKFFSA